MRDLFDIEWIVVDDASERPATPKPGATFVWLREQRGAAAARSAGATRATGEYLFFCDADVTLEPHCFKTMLTLLIAWAHVDVVHSKFRVGTRELGKPFTPEALHAGNFMSPMCLMRRSAYPADGWDANLRRFQDWDFWRRVLLRDGHDAAFVGEPMFTAQARRGSEAWQGHEEARAAVLAKGTEGWKR